MKKQSHSQINDEAGYEHALRSIDELIAAGFEDNPSKQKEFLEIARAIQAYEKKRYPLRMPDSIPEMITLKMFELKIPNQRKLADKLKVAPDKLSQILTGKRPPDVEFLKKSHNVLHIDAAFLLEHA